MWEEIVIYEEVDRWHDDKGKQFATGRKDGEWCGYGFARNANGFTRFFSFTANEDEVDPDRFFDSKFPMIYREHNGIEQIRILIDEPDLQLKEGERFPLMFQNYRFWREQEHHNQCSVYGERRYGDEIYLTIYGGGPSGGFIANADDETPSTRGSRSPGEQEDPPLPEGSELRWRYNPMDRYGSSWFRCLLLLSPIRFNSLSGLTP